MIDRNRDLEIREEVRRLIYRGLPKNSRPFDLIFDQRPKRNARDQARSKPQLSIGDLWRKLVVRRKSVE